MTRTIWVDGEVHLFPPEWCRPDYDPPRSETIIKRVIYEHPERELALSRATVDGLLAEMEVAGIDKAVIMGLPWREPEMCWRNNAYIAKVVQRYPDRFIGFAVLPPPGEADLRSAVRKAAEEYGLRGVKVIPSWQGFRLHDQIFEPALEALVTHDLVLMPHTDHLFISPDRGDTAYGLFDVARRYPELQIMAPHLGGLLCLYNLHEPVAAALRNILFITTVPVTMQMVEFAVQTIGPERIAFGTDFPFSPSHDQCTVRQMFDALSLTDKEKRLIAGMNLQGLLGEFG